MSDTIAIEDVPVVSPILEELPVDEEPVVEEVEEILADPEAPTEEIADGTEALAEETEALAEDTTADGLAKQTEGADAEMVAVLEQNSEVAQLLQTEQAIDRAVAAPEAPAVIEPEPLTGEKNSVTTGAGHELKSLADNTKAAAGNAADGVKAPVDPKVAAGAAPVGAASSVVSKNSKNIKVVKARVARKVLPKMLIGVPKDVKPLVILLRQKKKQGEDVSALVAACMAALGASTGSIKTTVIKH